MKLLIFLSRVAFLCNLFFIAAMILRYLEIAKKSTGSQDAVIPQGFVTGTIVVLGYSAVFLNLFMVVSYLVVAIKAKGRRTALPAWLVVANLAFFCIQLYFFFFL